MAEAGDAPRSLFARVVLRAATLPSVLVPAALGVVSAGVGAAAGEPFFGVLAVVGVAIAGGVVMSKLVWHSGELTRDVMLSEQQRSQRDHLAQLTDLAYRARAASEDGIAAQLDRLASVRKRMDDLADPDSGGLPGEIAAKAFQLYAVCRDQLMKAIELTDQTKRMLTPDGRRRLIEAKLELVEQVRGGVGSLAATLDDLHANRLTRDLDEASLQRTRAELDAGLEVARRAEDRLRAIEREAVRAAV